MPNLCAFEMHVKGKREDIEEFHQVMIDYEYQRHFYRVFDADICYNDDNEDTIAVIIGDCAHSVYTCMCKGEHTYANDFPEGSTSLQEESKILNLEIECYSEEIGSEFMEHYHYCNGNELADEERVFKVLYDNGWDMSIEECEERCKCKLDEKDIDDDGRITEGGFDKVFNF